MNIAISTKHSTEPFGSTVTDWEMVEGQIYQYDKYPEFLTARANNQIVYLSNGSITSWVAGTLLNKNSPLPTKAVVTLTQD